MTNTTTTTLASAIITKYEPKLLKEIGENLIFSKFADVDMEGVANNGTVRHNYLLQVPKVTTGRTEGTVLAYTSAKALTSNYLEFSPTVLEDCIAFTQESEFKAMITNDSKRQAVASQIARSCDYFMAKQICSFDGGFLAWRIDESTTYMANGTTDSGSTTTMVDNARTEIDDFWNGGRITITNPGGPNYGQTRHISDFATSGDILTHDAYNHVNTTSSKYHVCVGTGLTTTNTMSTTGFIDTATILNQYGVDTFAGGTYRMIMQYAQYKDLLGDTTFINSAIYDNSSKLEDFIGRGRWMGTEFLFTTEGWRESVAGAEDQASGAVYVAPVFGRHAYAMYYWDNVKGTPGYDAYKCNFYFINQPDRTDTTNAVKLFSWNVPIAGGPLLATRGVALLTGAAGASLFPYTS